MDATKHLIDPNHLPSTNTLCISRQPRPHKKNAEIGHIWETHSKIRMEMVSLYYIYSCYSLSLIELLVTSLVIPSIKNAMCIF